jgi:ammonia channel protein AmtB
MQQSQLFDRLIQKKRIFSVSGIAALALVNSIAAAAAGLVTWSVIDAIRGHVTVSGACVGPIVGLVAITPAAGFVQPGWALLFGIIPAFIIYFLILYKHHMRFDDTLDVTIVHGCGKIFTMKNIFDKNSFDFRWSDGSIYDWIIHPIIMEFRRCGWSFLWTTSSIVVSNSWNSYLYWYLSFLNQRNEYLFVEIGFAGACTALILLPLKYTIGIRLSPEDEMRGLDYIGKTIYFFSPNFFILISF